MSKADRSPVRRNTAPLPTKLRRGIWGQSLALSDCLENFQRRVQTMHVQIGIVLDVRKHNIKDEAVPMEHASHQLQREDISPQEKSQASWGDNNLLASHHPKCNTCISGGTCWVECWPPGSTSARAGMCRDRCLGDVGGGHDLLCFASLFCATSIEGMRACGPFHPRGGAS